MRHLPKKRFGQNFLHDAGVLQQIIEAIAPAPEDRMIEIGPGKGAMTARLLAHLNELHVVELDRDLVTLLQKAFANRGLIIHSADALQFQFDQVRTDERQLRIVGNLPYNISTPLLFHLAQYAPLVKDQHFMLQKEVVERMVAAPSTANYGRLSVMLQWRYDMEMVLLVGPQAFDPPPRVDSAVVRMMPWPQPADVQLKLLSELVQVAFSQRRKLLRHTLGQWLEARAFSGVFDVKRRAEEVAVAEYVALAQALTTKA